MEPYLGNYLAVPVKGIEAMLRMRDVILNAHQDHQEGMLRIAALEQALRQARINEKHDHQRWLDKHTKRRKPKRRSPFETMA